MSVYEKQDSIGELMTPQQVSELTGVKPATLAEWRSEKRELHFLKIARNVVRYRRSDVEAWLKSKRVLVEA